MLIASRKFDKVLAVIEHARFPRGRGLVLTPVPRKLYNFCRPNFSHNFSQDRIESYSATLTDEVSGVILREKTFLQPRFSVIRGAVDFPGKYSFLMYFF